jgi:hypothetical protein
MNASLLNNTGKTGKAVILMAIPIKTKGEKLYSAAGAN